MRTALLAGAIAHLLWAAASHAQPPPDLSRQLVVAFARDGQPLAARRLALERRLVAVGLTARGNLVTGLPVAAARTARSRDAFAVAPEDVWLYEAADSTAAGAALRALAGDPAVAWAEPNRLREPLTLPPGFPDDPMFRDGRQWGLRAIGALDAPGSGGAPGAWSYTTGSNDVLLAIADTGVDPDHPELAATLSSGPRVTLGINVTLEEPESAWADSFCHGTPVAGVMAARTHEGAHYDSLGIAGVCGGDGATNAGCRIVPIKISPGRSGYASSFSIARAIYYATTVGARALNLSFGGFAPSRAELAALYHAVTNGLVVVAAAGNLGAVDPLRPVYPAAYAREGLCIQVGSSDPWDRRSAFSSYGPGLDLLAPGEQVWTTFMSYPTPSGYWPGPYTAASGTSFATPFVTGAVGLIAALEPRLTDSNFQRLLQETATDLGPEGWDETTGWGRLDVARALASVAGLGVWHDEQAAFTVVETRRDRLFTPDGGVGMFDVPLFGVPAAEFEATAEVAIPDSFLAPVRVWPRVGGTTTVRGGFEPGLLAPWAEVQLVGEDRFRLRGYSYRTLLEGCPECTEERWVPLAPDQMRFGFTVIGRVDRPPTVTVLGPAARDTLTPGDTVTVRWRAEDPDQVTAVEVWLEPPFGRPRRLARTAGDQVAASALVPCGTGVGGARLRVIALDEHGRQHDRGAAELEVELGAADCALVPGFGPRAAPNPFRGVTRLTGFAGERLAIHDPGGRRVRTLAVPAGGGVATWDGRDEAGRTLAPGVYLVRGADGRLRGRVVKLD